MSKVVVPVSQRVIPILDLYREVLIPNPDMQVVMGCANNYPAKLQLKHGIDDLFTFNDNVRRECGLQVVEVSDDCIDPGQIMGADEIIAGYRARTENPLDGNRIEDLLTPIHQKAQDAGVYMIAMGTGALFSYAHVKAEGTAFFDRNRKGQAHWLRLFKGWADLATELGLQLYTGRRPGVLEDETTFTEEIAIGDLAEYLRRVSIIDLKDLKFNGLNPRTKITQSEAMNLGLALIMNRQSPNIMQLVEQMQYQGMEPTTVEQVVRLNRFMTANLPWGFYGDMADNGHVGVRGTRLTTYPRDYDLLCYAKAYQGPIVFIHQNIIYQNAKQPGTKANIEQDLAYRDGKIVGKDMPHPERIRDINNEYAVAVLRNHRVRLAILSPEPTCNMRTDLDQLALDVSEAVNLTSDCIKAIGLYEPISLMPHVYVTKGYAGVLERFLCERVHRN